MDKYTSLLRSLGLYAVGTAGVQIISFIMLPFYTRFLKASEFGVVDITLVLLVLAAPIASMSVYEGVLRFAMDSLEEARKYLAAALIVVAIGFSGFIVVLMLGDAFAFYSLPPLFELVLLAQLLHLVLSQYARARGLTKLFVLNGLLAAFALAACNVVLIGALGLGVAGFMASLLVSYCLAFSHLGVSLRYDLANMRLPGKSRIQALVRFSLPLVPNSAMWWVMTSMARVVLLQNYGLRSVGYYAVASRLPAMLTVLAVVFSRAWQQAAYQEFSKPAAAAFYSRVFGALLTFLLIASSILFAVLRPVYPVFVGPEFEESWVLVPPLLIAVVLQSISGFLGTTYSASLKTRGALWSSLTGGVAAVVLCLLLIPPFGAVGASSAVAGGFFVLTLHRFVGTRKFVRLSLPERPLVFAFLVVVAQVTLLYVLRESVVVSWIAQFTMCLVVLCLLNHEVRSVSRLIRLK